jgi:hypothetical protein
LQFPGSGAFSITFAFPSASWIVRVTTLIRSAVSAFCSFFAVEIASSLALVAVALFCVGVPVMAGIGKLEVLEQRKPGQRHADELPEAPVTEPCYNARSNALESAADEEPGHRLHTGVSDSGTDPLIPEGSS